MSIDVLQSKIRKLKNPTVLKLSPSVSELPPQVLSKAVETHGNTLQAVAEGYREYCFALLDSLCKLIPAVSVAAAPFFALGSAGLSVLERVLSYAKQKDYYVIFDLNCALPPEQSQLLADGVFAGTCVGDAMLSPYSADCVTVNGYHGTDSIRPWLPYCKQDKSLVLLVKSANKSGREVQELLSGDRVIYTAMADLAMRWSTGLFGANGYSQIAVSCCTGNGVLSQMRKNYDRLFLLVDGLDAPSISVMHTADAFDRFGHGAAVLVGSRITSAWKKQETDGADYLALAKAAAEKLKTDFLKNVVIL
ncbi:MAG: hypothetical protein MJ085_05590 [Clostridia bacterium]|nr:hypothetical protein [Clostridia bacterium]